jgi:nitric oxide reductase subunit B
MIVWSVLSLAALLGGTGVLLAAFGRWSFLGWHERERQSLTFRAPGEVVLTPGQRVTGWFFFVMALLFLIQTLVGGASQHYRAELSGFFGIDLARILPFNLARTWHVQLAIFWVSTSYLASGIFLAPMLSGREPKHQKKFAIGLLGALALVVFGSMAGEFAGIHGLIQKYWSWFGDQGFEYLDLGRFWQLLLTLGLCAWVMMLSFGLRGRLRTEHKGNYWAVMFLVSVGFWNFLGAGIFGFLINLPVVSYYEIGTALTTNHGMPP